jgi:hypothetical protein
MRPLICIILLLAFAGGAPVEAAKKAAAKKKEHTFTGTVVKVHHGKTKGHGTFTVEHKGAGKGKKKFHLFHVNAKTTFEQAGAKGKGKGKGGSPGLRSTNFGHLHKGQHVIVHYHGKNHADDVKIAGKKKK